MAEIIECVNKMGWTVYEVDGIEYGNYETAKHMFEYGKKLKRDIKMKNFSKNKLRHHFENKGYQVVKEAGDTWTIQTHDIYVTIVVFRLITSQNVTAPKPVFTIILAIYHLLVPTSQHREIGNTQEQLLLFIMEMYTITSMAIVFSMLVNLTRQ